MPQQNYVDSSQPLLSVREVGKFTISLAMYAILAIIYSELAIWLPPLPIVGRVIYFLFTFTVCITLFGVYFNIKNKQSIILDPWESKKMSVAVSWLLFLFLFYRLEHGQPFLLAGIIVGDGLCLYYFRQYLLGVSMTNNSNDKENLAKGYWLGLPTGCYLLALMLRYLFWTGESLPNKLALAISNVLLLVPLLTVMLYRFFAWGRKITFSGENPNEKKLFMHQYSKYYPINTKIQFLSRIKDRIRTVGEQIAKHVLTSIMKSEREKLQDWEKSYVEYSGHALMAYITMVYFVPLIWTMIYQLPTIYVVAPPFDFGLYGLSLVFFGSLFLAVDPLTSVPSIDEIDQPLILVASHLGFLLLATGTLFQTSSQIPLESAYTFFEMNLYTQHPYISRSLFLEILRISRILATLITTPLFLALIYLSYKGYKCR